MADQLGGLGGGLNISSLLSSLLGSANSNSTPTSSGSRIGSFQVGNNVSVSWGTSTSTSGQASSGPGLRGAAGQNIPSLSS